MKLIVLVLGIVALASGVLAQTEQPIPPTAPGMYVETSGGVITIIGQIAEFKRSGSWLVSHATVDIKSQKENIQLLGPHAQTVVSPQPTFYFIPAKQEAEAGVNAGDLILIRLEEKPKRRQFEIAARGAWRSSSGISLTHQVQLLRSEVKPGVYRIVSVATLNEGEYALYLSRGEGMAPYVYDFGVQENGQVATAPIALKEQAASTADKASLPHPSAADFISASRPEAAKLEVFKEATIGVFCDGSPDIRHDGVQLTALTPGGPADESGIRAGDFILAINDHYLFTIRQLQEEISHYRPGTTIDIRYRRYSAINEVAVEVGRVQ